MSQSQHKRGKKRKLNDLNAIEPIKANNNPSYYNQSNGNELEKMKAYLEGMTPQELTACCMQLVSMNPNTKNKLDALQYLKEEIQNANVFIPNECQTDMIGIKWKGDNIKISKVFEIQCTHPLGGPGDFEKVLEEKTRNGYRRYFKCCGECEDDYTVEFVICHNWNGEQMLKGTIDGKCGHGDYHSHEIIRAYPVDSDDYIIYNPSGNDSGFSDQDTQSEEISPKLFDGHSQQKKGDCESPTTKPKNKNVTPFSAEQLERIKRNREAALIRLQKFKKRKTNCEQRNTCPKKHKLMRNIMQANQSGRCDGCGTKFAIMQTYYGCRLCNFDLCLNCYINID